MIGLPVRGRLARGAALSISLATGGVLAPTSPVPTPPPVPPTPLADPVGRVVNVTAVLDDGSRRAPGIPLDTRRPLRLVASEDAVVKIALVTPDGAPVALDLANGDSLVVAVRETSSSTPRLSVGAVRQVSRRRGLYVATIAAGALRQVAGRTVQWFMTATRGGKSFRVVGVSELRVSL